MIGLFRLPAEGSKVESVGLLSCDFFSMKLMKALFRNKQLGGTSLGAHQ
jgi:hypothetical protein